MDIVDEEKKYKLTVFRSKTSTQGNIVEKTFGEIYYKFKTKVKITPETYNAYVSSSKEVQGKIKDVGGFIGGETDGARRIQGVRVKRSILTLDIDSKYPDVLEYLKNTVDFYCFVHTTHSHSKENNRYRIIAPLSREVSENEYEAVGRKIAYLIENNQQFGPKKSLFDETTFQAQRMMFFPSCSYDAEYVCELLNFDIMLKEQKVIDVDLILNTYLDRNNIYEWFSPEKIDDDGSGRNSLQNKNPLKAKGLVGAFNRTFKISEAIARFLPDVYKKESNGRYTYIKGESFCGGKIFNDDTIFYTHHGTDPANMYYRSAFDLVRIHLFGKSDNSFTPEKEVDGLTWEKTDSFMSMIDFCKSLPEVVRNSDQCVAIIQRMDNSSSDKPIETSLPIEEEEETKPKEIKNKEWINLVESATSKMEKMRIILNNDEIIGNLFYYDVFRENICFLRKPNWSTSFHSAMPLQDRDMAHIRSRLEEIYHLKGKDQIDDAIVVNADQIQRNFILEYLDGLEWDGVERLSVFFHDFFKVKINPFTETALKHWMVGSVGRIYKAGTPFDKLLIIKGLQGIGKSLFFKKIATIDFEKNPTEHFYSDTKIDFDHAKDSYEQLDGIWIYEWKELTGMNMSEQESIKAFVDKTEDKYRRSYGRRMVEVKRRVVFGGTTNSDKPLRDLTGNRRFFVMDSPLKEDECYIKDFKKDGFTNYYKDQMWAEAVHYYKEGFDPLEFTDEEMEWWKKSNEENLEDNDLIGNIQSYLEMKKPDSWYSMDIESMSKYYHDYDFENNKSNSPMWNDSENFKSSNRVCILELWKIALKQREVTVDRYHRELIKQAIKKLGWKETTKTSRFGEFGTQRAIIQEGDVIFDENDLPF